MRACMNVPVSDGGVRKLWYGAVVVGVALESEDLHQHACNGAFLHFDALPNQRGKVVQVSHCACTGC
jgi:hypothetical protein